MSKKVSESNKKDFIQSFISGEKIKNISLKFGFSIPTIIRQLKNNLGEFEYEKIKIANKNKKKNFKLFDVESSEIDNKKIVESVINYENKFIEIAPIDVEFDLDNQKELSSKPLAEVNLPKLVYIIVSSKIELHTKLLKEYHDWHFLPAEDLERKTIEIFFDLKSAKRLCNKDQKVIKVPNSNIFKIVAPILINRGISRIISESRLISL